MILTRRGKPFSFNSSLSQFDSSIDSSTLLTPPSLTQDPGSLSHRWAWQQIQL